MAGLEIRHGGYDDVRALDHATAEVLTFSGGLSATRYTLAPGWRWSRTVGALAGMSRCESEHLGYCLAGRLHVEMADGESGEISAGDVVHIRPGHDAWVVGDSPCVLLEFTGAGVSPAGGIRDLARWESAESAPV